MIKLLQLFGMSGSVLVLFGLIAYFFPPHNADPFVLFHLVIGSLMLLVFLSTQGMSVIRALRLRSTRYGLHSVFYSLIFLGILILLNFLSSRYYLRWDLTEEKIFSLSPQSIKVARGLHQDLEVYGFFDGGENTKVTNLIEGYQYYSSRIKFQLVDPSRHPEMSKRFNVRQAVTLHLRYGNESVSLENPTEGAITNAILKLTGKEKERIYYLTGHGEPSLTDLERDQGFAVARETLENNNYQVEEMPLSTMKRVPEDAALVLIAGPEKALLELEIKAIDDYLKTGGRLLALLPPPDNNTLNGYLKRWGVDVGNNIVVDQVIRLFSGPSLGIQPIVETYSDSHPVTRGFTERTIFPMARAVEPISKNWEGLETVSLVKTSATSWAETDVDTIFGQGKASLGKDDLKGPISLAVGVTAKLQGSGADGAREAKMIVVGSTTFANNKFIRVFFNRTLFLNMANWLIGEDRVLSIRPRSMRPSRIDLTAKESSTVLYLTFFILPEILLVAGLAVWWNRR